MSILSVRNERRLGPTEINSAASKVAWASGAACRIAAAGMEVLAATAWGTVDTVEVFMVTEVGLGVQRMTSKIPDVEAAASSMNTMSTTKQMRLRRRDVDRVLRAPEQSSPSRRNRKSLNKICLTLATTSRPQRLLLLASSLRRAAVVVLTSLTPSQRMTMTILTTSSPLRLLRSRHLRATNSLFLLHPPLSAPTRTLNSLLPSLCLGLRVQT